MLALGSMMTMGGAATLLDGGEQERTGARRTKATL